MRVGEGRAVINVIKFENKSVMASHTLHISVNYLGSVRFFGYLHSEQYSRPLL
jgi:hypothetical protein